jgi:serine protease Do
MKETILMEFSNDVEEIVGTASKNILHIGGDGIPYRTGIILDDGYIVSVASAAREGESISVFDYDRKRTDAVVKGFDGRTGIVVLQSKEKGAASVTWEGETARVGMLAITLAFASEEGAEARLDMVRASGSDYFQTDGNPFPGFRGAPVLSPSGKLLGIVTSNIPGNGGIVLPFENLMKLVGRLKEHGSTSRRILGVRTEQVKDGLLVMEVIPESPSESAGIRVGDIILQLNNKPLGDPLSLHRELQSSSGDAELAISRGGQSIIIRVAPREEKETFHPRWKNG